MDRFGSYLRHARTEAGLSQRAVAEGCGIDVSYISKLENGRLPHTPSARTLSALARVLRTDEIGLFEAAGKLVGPLAEISRQPAALEVMRVASERIDSDTGWQTLRDFIESERFSEQLAAADRR